MPEMVSVGEAARLCRARSPKDVTALFYRGELREDLCPIIGGRRLIPRDYLPVLEMVLRRRGWQLPERQAVQS
jgi:hypothetical protein